MLHLAHSAWTCIGEQPEITEAEAINKAVASRMEQLDEAFLVALAAYISAAEEQGDASLAGIPQVCNISAPVFTEHYCSVLSNSANGANSDAHCTPALRAAATFCDHQS